MQPKGQAGGNDFDENYISRELLSLLKRVNGNKFERMDNMNKEIQILSDEKIKEMGRRTKDKRKKGTKLLILQI